jgi:hypothetical protein
MLEADDEVFHLVREFNGRPTSEEGKERLTRAVRTVKVASWRIPILDRHRQTRFLAGRIGELMFQALGHGPEPAPAAAVISQAWRDAQKQMLGVLEQRFGR